MTDLSSDPSRFRPEGGAYGTSAKPDSLSIKGVGRGRKIKGLGDRRRLDERPEWWREIDQMIAARKQEASVVADQRPEDRDPALSSLREEGADRVRGGPAAVQRDHGWVRGTAPDATHPAAGVKSGASVRISERRLSGTTYEANKRA
jgi:hypothetical protein